MRLTKPPAEMQVRSCACSFCRAHATRTVSDAAGQAEVRADWSLVAKYRFGTRTADYLLCRRCGVYVGAVCDTPAGLRAVINTRCLDDQAAFVQTAVHPDYDNETVEARLARRALNWTPVSLHDAV
ncbi:MAG: aldehyde-activating protein [Proteobacteria bacterium]|nr:aldehyde-activating protein [Pseudomonadota bacterium]